MVNGQHRNERIGMFGGTFDPPHTGHLIVAAHVREELGLDRIIFIPAMTPPHKQDRAVTAGRHRLAMVERAIEGDPHFAVSDCELRRGGVSYTIDTVQDLLRTHSGAELTVLIGMDNLVDFSTWRDPEGILSRAAVVVMTRPGFTHGPGDAPFLTRMRLCEVPDIGIAARDIRRRVSEGRSIRYLVPAGVEEYVATHGLYR